MPERRPRLARLEGKVAIVTGAGSSGEGIGNGKATAVLFAREGAKVLLVDMVKERAEETLAMIHEEEGEASLFQADVTSAADCRRMVETAMERYGRLDILDNNVGVSQRGTVLDVSEEDWDRILTINIKTMVQASKAAIPLMIESGGGAIINISSIAGLRAHSSTPYSVSKAGVIGLTFSMAADHAKDNIRVNCIAPGLLYTPMTAPRMTADLREHRKNAAPLATEGTGWDVGYAALFLASDEARWITGIVMPVDAGLLAVSPATYAPMDQQTRV
ncbi:MAG: SDR family oxidoreductase [Dehalococcoidia bacterium]|nr:SDR family oxidoreductase [Dehalococcoidia bacterium]